MRRKTKEPKSSKEKEAMAAQVQIQLDNIKVYKSKKKLNKSTKPKERTKNPKFSDWINENAKPSKFSQISLKFEQTGGFSDLY